MFNRAGYIRKYNFRRRAKNLELSQSAENIALKIVYPQIDGFGEDRVWKAIVRRCNMLSFRPYQNDRVFKPYVNRPVDYGDF